MVLQNYASISQSSKDSCTCIPNDTLRLAAEKIEQGKLDFKELELANRNIILLNARVAVKDNKIKEISKNLLIAQQTIQAFKEKDSIHNEVDKITGNQISSFKKQVRQQKTKKVLIIIGAVIVEVLTLYIKFK